MVLQQHTSILCYRVRVQMYPVKQPTILVASNSTIISATAQRSTKITPLIKRGTSFFFLFFFFCFENSSLTRCFFYRSAPVLSGLKQFRTHSAVIDNRTACIFYCATTRVNQDKKDISLRDICSIGNWRLMIFVLM